ncbi:hypothetical protein M3N55_12030 [Roseibaca sp. V10]|uniref:Uncharacterized protein n=1 Tax=Roseinatronobacter domitianus TaxID=2940293 RepID=A0ABT0M3N0_9RHOB|nr:hypothetical protein [Roseibaca domitiana]MCL1629459.1 hypothetical protein [Roseibaca domitiana]
MTVPTPFLSSRQKTPLLATSDTPKKNLRIACVLAFLSPLFLVGPALAEEENISTELRFEVVGERLMFNGRVAREDGYVGIEYGDARDLRQILRDNPEITTLELDSDGGVRLAALEMTVAVTDFGLNTVVTERCESACTLVFLAGETRTLTRGARLGFHSGSWAPDSMKEFYEDMRESSGWLDEFAFASWAYEEGLRAFNKSLEFLVSRGVDVQFITRAAYVNFSDIWYPTRDELVKFGIIHLPE